MGENSKIEWTHHTFNPWIGCQRVSPGCTNCYAEARDHRFTGGSNWGPRGTRTVTSDSNWRKPLAWDRAAAAAGERHRVFCASLADVFEDRPDLVAMRSRLFLLIQNTPHLDWLLLTKRPQNMVRLAVEAGWEGVWPANAWAGTTVEDQQRADERIPHLLRVPAAVRFLSCEPLLGPVDLRPWIGYASYPGPIAGTCFNIDGESWHDAEEKCRACGWGYPNEPAIPGRVAGLDWVICGGESGHNARPMHPNWARALLGQCHAAGVAFLFKQWGEWCPTTCDMGIRPGYLPLQNGEDWASGVRDHDFGDGYFAIARGKHAAGRMLDGRIHDGFPACAQAAPWLHARLDAELPHV